MTSIDLNADLGELAGSEGRTMDAAILAQVTSASIACGGHAGDADTMRASFAAARDAGVRAGAHPSYPDPANFGRVSMTMPAGALVDALEDQVSGAAAAAKSEGVRLRHLKPHGALYHDTKRADVAAIVTACARRHGLDIYGPPTGMLARTAAEAGTAYRAEGFADRAYRGGDLVPRTEPGAVIVDEAAQAEQALRLAQGAGPEAAWPDGPRAAVRTICLHGDTPGAADAAARLRAALEAGGIRVASC